MGNFLKPFGFKKVGGRFGSIDEFLEYFLKLSSEDKENLLFSVYRQYGKNSEEFLSAFQCFVFWALNRYFSDVDIDDDERYDVVSDCILRMMEKIDFYDKEKGTFLTFLHSIVRDAISRRKYLYLVKNMRNVYVDRRDEDDENGDGEKVIGMFDRIMLDKMMTDGDACLDSLIVEILNKDGDVFTYFGDSVYWRKWFWEAMKKVLIGE